MGFVRLLPRSGSRSEGSVVEAEPDVAVSDFCPNLP